MRIYQKPSVRFGRFGAPTIEELKEIKMARPVRGCNACMVRMGRADVVAFNNPDTLYKRMERYHPTHPETGEVFRFEGSVYVPVAGVDFEIDHRYTLSLIKRYTALEAAATVQALGAPVAQARACTVLAPAETLALTCYTAPAHLRQALPNAAAQDAQVADDLSAAPKDPRRPVQVRHIRPFNMLSPERCLPPPRRARSRRRRACPRRRRR